MISNPNINLTENHMVVDEIYPQPKSDNVCDGCGHSFCRCDDAWDDRD